MTNDSPPPPSPTTNRGSFTVDYIKGGQYIVMMLTSNHIPRDYYTPVYANGNAVDTVNEAREQVAECIAEDDPANPHTYKIFKLTPVEEK
jgi:hypothetical protein